MYSYSSEYTSGFSRPAASHLAAPPSPRHEGNVGQAPTRMLRNSSTVPQTVAREARSEVQGSKFRKPRTLPSRLSLQSRVSRAAILRECPPVVPHVRTLKVLACHHCFSATCSRASPALARNESVERIEAHSYRRTRLARSGSSRTHGVPRSRYRSSLAEARSLIRRENTILFPVLELTRTAPFIFS